MLGPKHLPWWWGHARWPPLQVDTFASTFSLCCQRWAEPGLLDLVTLTFIVVPITLFLVLTWGHSFSRFVPQGAVLVCIKWKRRVLRMILWGGSTHRCGRHRVKSFPQSSLLGTYTPRTLPQCVWSPGTPGRHCPLPSRTVRPLAPLTTMDSCPPSVNLDFQPFLVHTY